MTNQSLNQRGEDYARWWESYLVRYAIGTVIGALCAYILLEAAGDDLKSRFLMIPPVTQDHISALVEACKKINANACAAQLQLFQGLYSFNIAQLLLLGIYGLAYCYIASAPGLVIHAVRGGMCLKDPGSRSAWYWCCTLTLVSIFLFCQPLFSYRIHALWQGWCC